MIKQTVIDRIEISRDGTINIRMAKEVIDDDGTVISSGWHRTVLPPGLNIDAQFAAVNENLVRGLKCSPVAASDIERLKAVVPVVHTKAVKDAYVARMAMEEAKAKSG